jgi:hypothetical protein
MPIFAPKTKVDPELRAAEINMIFAGNTLMRYLFVDEDVESGFAPLLRCLCGAHVSHLDTTVGHTEFCPAALWIKAVERLQEAVR